MSIPIYPIFNSQQSHAMLALILVNISNIVSPCLTMLGIFGFSDGNVTLILISLFVLVYILYSGFSDSFGGIC